MADPKAIAEEQARSEALLAFTTKAQLSAPPDVIEVTSAQLGKIVARIAELEERVATLEAP